MRRGLRGRLSLAGPTLTRWAGPEPPTEAALDGILRREGLTPRWWENGPGDRYAGHAHPYHKVLYCLRGSIRFESGSDRFDLGPGDRLEIPPDTPHGAIVGPEGVRCVEAARP